MTGSIHPSACVHAHARLHPTVAVGPFALIEADVEVGEGTVVAAHAVLKSGTRWGRRGTIGEHAVVGGEAQHLGHRGAPGRLVVGDDVTIREGVTIHRSTSAERATEVGDRSYLMAQSHVAHDCVVGEDVVLVNHTLLAGHVVIGARAVLGGSVGVHQFCRIGELSMIGAHTKVTQDCLPFVLVDGNPARAIGLNRIGLQRSSLSAATIVALKRAFLALTAIGSGSAHAAEQLAAHELPEVRAMAAMVLQSTRGIVRRRELRPR